MVGSEETARIDGVVWCEVNFRTKRNLRYRLTVTTMSDRLVCDFTRINPMGVKRGILRYIVEPESEFHGSINEFMVGIRDYFFGLYDEFRPKKSDKIEETDSNEVV